MRSTFTTTRARLAASATAVLGITALGGCQPRAVPEQEAYTPQPVAAPQQPYNNATTFAIGEEDSGYAAPTENYATTYAIGEEEGGYASPTDNFVTTLAVGEEDGTGPIPVEPNGGIGDGAGPIPFDPDTPLPIGEVQGDYERIYIGPDPDNVGQPYNDGFATTLAIGEEG